jgi:hypothetical protein
MARRQLRRASIEFPSTVDSIDDAVVELADLAFGAGCLVERAGLLRGVTARTVKIDRPTPAADIPTLIPPS